MASTTALCTTARLAFMKGELNAADAYNLALYTSSATHGAGTTVYSATNEVVGAGYTAGGKVLTGYAAASSGVVAVLDWADVSWTGASFTAASCLIWDDTDPVGPNRAVSVHDFGGNQTVAGGTFTLQFPTADSITGIIRI